MGRRGAGALESCSAIAEPFFGAGAAGSFPARAANCALAGAAGDIAIEPVGGMVGTEERAVPLLPG